MFNSDSAPAVNEMGVLWDNHFGHDGLCETDRMVLIAADRTADQAELARLRAELAAAKDQIASLQIDLDEAQANAASDADALAALICVIEAEVDATPLFAPITVVEELARR